MKKIKLFFALFAMLALNVGNAWAETVSNTWDLTSSSSDWTNEGCVTYFSQPYGIKKKGAYIINKNISDFINYSSTATSIKIGVKSLCNGATSSKLTVSLVDESGNVVGTGLEITPDNASAASNTTYQYVTFTSNFANIAGYKIECTTFGKNILINGTSYEITYTPSAGGSTEPAVSMPTFSVPEGTFYSPINVELSCETAGAEIHYTLDGSTPSSTSETYTSAIAISETTTVKAIAVKDGLTDSEVATATYTKGETVTSYDIDFETNALEAYVNWDFSNITITTATIQAKGGTYYGNTSGKASAYIKTKEKIQYPGILTFSVSKESDNTTASNWLVQVSENGTTWSTVGTISATEMTKGNWNDHSVDLSDYENVYVQISYSGSTAIRAIDKISLAQGVAPVKYTLTIENPENGTLSVTKGGVSVASGDQFKAGTSLVVTPTPASGYLFESLTVDGTPVDLTEGSYNLTMPAANVTIAATFKENEKPDATLTLSKNGETEDITGYKQDDKVTLPSITSDCVKEFVGWDANASCATEPEYKAGDEYTLASTTQTLYAVYADGEEGAPVNKFSETFDNCNGTGGNDGKWSGSIASAALPDALKNTWTVANAYAANKCAKFGGSSNKQGSAETPLIAFTGTATLTFSAAAWEGTDEGTTLNISATGATLNQSSVTLTKAQWTTYTVAITEATGAVKIKFEANNASNNRFFLDDVVVSQASVTYSNYSTTCVAAPKAEVNPTAVSATAAGANDKVEVTYENVNTENVAVALFNDEACTEAFTAGWLTAAFDADKNITYTVTENTTYAERKAYIKLTAPETTGATEPAVVVIPVTQAAKDKVFASLAELVAADLTAGDEVTVTLNNDVIKEFYIYNSNRAGVVFDVQKDGKDIKIYFNNQTTIVDWAVGGKLSGTLTNVKWTTYSSAWQLAPANTWAWANLTYTEPKAVSTVVVSGAPTKTTYVDGEAFDPEGLTVTVNYNDPTSEVNPTGVTFTVTPATLVKGQTSVSVTATFNSVASAAYEVTGLTVNDIPTKTVAEFIAAGGGRCYLEGIVSNITNTTYGNFDLTDASGTIYVYGCLNGAGESKKFAELGVKNGDKIKVIADEYELYQTTKPEAKNVQYVSHISAATITIADITMEVDEVKNISATVEPAEAEVTYTIKKNAANAISLSGNTITALAVGTAIITATVENGATYMGNSVDFTVTVGPKTEKTDVVILAELDGKWYAMKGAVPSGKSNQLDAVEVTYFNGTLYNVEDKASITWTRTIVDGKATFVNNGKYLKGTSDDTNLVLDDSKCEWTFNGTTYTIGSRTFLYRENYNFKNYTTDKAGTLNAQGNYSSLPVVTAAKFETATFYTRSELPVGSYGTICLPYAVNNYTGATFYEVAGKEDSKIVFDEVTELEAGKPYIFMAEAAEIKLAQVGEEYTGSAKLHNSLQGTFNQIDPAEDNILVGNYMVVNNVIKKCGKNCGLKANRAYFVAAELENNLGAAPQPMPGRRRVTMGVTGENEATGVDNITENGVIAPKKLIENGQLIIIRDGVKYNVQGQKL